MKKQVVHLSNEEVIMQNIISSMVYVFIQVYFQQIFSFLPPTKKKSIKVFI